MTKKDKAYLAEGLHRLCADLAAIATLFEQSDDASAKPTPAEDPPATPAPEETNKQAPTPVPDPPAPAKPVTYEEVRAILADKSRTGYRAEVKALLTAHGVRQLSEIEYPAIYVELIREAEDIGNG